MQETPDPSLPSPAGPARLARLLVAFGGNRLELFTLELEEEQQHFLEVSLLALSAAVLALLAGLGFTAALVVLLWQTSPVAVLLALGICYATGAVLLYRRLVFVRRDWKTFPATVEQLQKDGECLKEILT
jgi:uncharacterized membrane protein YqjE